MRAQKKNVVKLLSLFLAVLLAAGGVLTVSAGADKEEKPDSKEKVGGTAWQVNRKTGL